jgi:VWFA-related protein
MKPLAVAVAFVLAVDALSGAQQAPAQQETQPKSTFKSSVDLVPVDVNVLDRTGRPVSDLTPDDFTLKVDGKLRRIATAQFIAATRNVEQAPQPTDYSTNPPSAGGRLIMLVVDQGNIGVAHGKYAIEAAGRFVSRLTPADRVGLVTIPGAGPQINFTANHALVRQTLQSIVGLWEQGEHQDNQIGLSEAIEVEHGNDRVIQQILDRECTGLGAGEDLNACRTKLVGQAHTLYLDLKSRTRDSLVSLNHVMDRLAKTQTPKTVVLISEGLILERGTSEVTWLPPLVSRGQVSLYVLQLTPNVFDATGVQTSPTRGTDIELGHDGLDTLAGIARGSVFKVISGADNAFARLTTELSGYYLLSFEPEPGDRDSKSHKIKIDVPRRSNLTVRARTDYTMDPPRVLTPQQQLADVLAAPLLGTDIGLKLTTYLFTENEGEKVRVMLAAEVDRSQNPRSRLSLAYTVVDNKDRVVSAQVEPDMNEPIQPATHTQTYLNAVSLSPGTYIVKLAVVDDEGKRGSVERTVKAQLAQAGQIHMTDLLLGDDSGGGGLQPSVSAQFTGDALHGYLELRSEASQMLESAAITLEVAQNDTSRALDEAPARFQPQSASAPGRRVAEGAVPIALLPPGEYVARAVVTVAGRKVGQVTRPFRIVRTAANANAPEAVAHAAGLAPKTAIPFVSRPEAFDRTSVVAPQVVSFFVDRMNVGRDSTPVPAGVAAAAKAGKIDEAADAAKKEGTHQLAIAFFDGLARYQKGDLEGAAGRFRESLRLQSDFFPAAFYLGACYAAGGHDREAAGAWQTSLITESEAPFIYTLLGDAFVRLKEYDSAIDILKEAAALWPASDQVQPRLGTAYAQAGKPVDAVLALDPYLVQHQQDQERLLVALKAIYDARSAGLSIGSAAEDRARFERYAAAYAAAGGTQTALIEQWRKFVAR